MVICRKDELLERDGEAIEHDSVIVGLMVQ